LGIEPKAAALRTHVDRTTAWRLGDTVSVRLRHRWDDDEDRPEPDLTDPATAAALARAARGVRMVKRIHLTLLALGIGLFALALLLKLN
jgi:hypothetical protein